MTNKPTTPQEHMQEPWTVQNGDPLNPTNQPSNIYSEFMSSTDGVKYVGDPVSLFMKEANAQRIVTCVNECAGLTPDQIREAVRLLSIKDELESTLLSAASVESEFSCREYIDEVLPLLRGKE